MRFEVEHISCNYWLQEEQNKNWGIFWKIIEPFKLPAQIWMFKFGQLFQGIWKALTFKQALKFSEDPRSGLLTHTHTQTNTHRHRHREKEKGRS